MAEEEAHLMENADLLNKALSRVGTDIGEFDSPSFLVPEGEGTFRLKTRRMLRNADQTVEMVSESPGKLFRYLEEGEEVGERDTCIVHSPAGEFKPALMVEVT